MRFLAAFLLAAAVTAAADAHFVFVYVDGPDAKLVFGHDAAPDPDLFPTRAEKTNLTARDGAGKETKLTVEKGAGNFFRAKLPAGPVVVYGTTEAGVTQRGDAPPMLSWYYPKVIVGDPFAANLGGAKALDVAPVRDGEKVRFRVVADGKAVADAEVTVGLSGKGEEKAETVKTDAAGLTPAFAGQGRFVVAARQVEAKGGDFGGKSYASVRHTATLVCDIPAPGR
ncbi:MAG: DUF4198 domain-containing protein [Gemmataceae bacterium]